MENIVVVAFDVPSKAYQALSVVKGLDQSMKLTLHAAAVVERQPNGQPVVRDGINSVEPFGTLWGGLFGALLGVLGGPVGAVAGWSAGTIAGAAGDALTVDRSESLLGTISERIPAGTTALLVDADEYANEVIDGTMIQLGGFVYRQSAEDLRADIKAAKNAKRAAEKEAKHHEREAHRQERERQDAVDHNERIDGLEARLNKMESWLEGRKDPVEPASASN